MAYTMSGSYGLINPLRCQWLVIQKKIDRSIVGGRRQSRPVKSAWGPPDGSVRARVEQSDTLIHFYVRVSRNTSQLF